MFSLLQSKLLHWTITHFEPFYLRFLLQQGFNLCYLLYFDVFFSEPPFANSISWAYRFIFSYHTNPVRKSLEYLYFLSSYNILLLIFKIVSWWYLIPAKLSFIHSNVSLLCWKGCGQLGMYFHAWLSCKLVSQFWSHIIAFIKRIIPENNSRK